MPLAFPLALSVRYDVIEGLVCKQKQMGSGFGREPCGPPPSMSEGVDVFQMLASSLC
jgi:hypothetical protein